MSAIRDLTNTRINKLIPLYIDRIERKKGQSVVFWVCLCDCGSYVSLASGFLFSGRAQSCGCIKEKKYQNARTECIGKQFGYLTVIAFDHLGKNRKIYLICRCKEGKITIVPKESLINGHTTSCGCKSVETNTKHGFSTSKDRVKLLFYRIWEGMKRRCYNPHISEYKHYGGRGIKMCKRWLKFENFKEDMWESYLEHLKEFGKDDTSIERIEVMGNYEPSNCKWATNDEQGKNRRNSPQTLNLKEHNYWRDRLCGVIGLAIRSNFIESIPFEHYVGCTIAEFKQHIESLWLPSMNWNNRGKYTKKGLLRWQFDHIVGINNFDLSKEADRLKCFHYTNIQPMWGDAHMRKSKLVLELV